MTRLTVLLGCLLALTSCSTSDAGGQPLTPHDLLLDTAPSGFTGKVDTPLSIDSASSTLSTAPGPTKTQLSTLGYTDGAEKVSSSGDEYVVDLVFQFNSPVGPGSMVGFIRSQLATHAAATLFSDSDVPGAQAFNVYATTRAGGRQVFCEGAVFPLDLYMFLLEDCADGPRYAAGPLTLTRTQYVRAAKLLGLAVASPSSS